MLARVCFLLSVISTSYVCGVGARAPTQHSDANEMKNVIEFYSTGRHLREDRIEYLPFGKGKRPIIISTPKDLEPDEKNPRPVLVILDGLIQHPQQLGIIQGLQPIIIGVPSGNRMKDLAGPRPKEGYMSDPAGQYTVPDADAFVDFLAKTLSPYIDREFPNTPVKILSGFSLGGLATVHALLRYPEAFDAYIAGSPSLWYNTDYYLELARDAAKRLNRPKRFKKRCLALCAAEDEPEILTATRKMERLMRQLDLPLHIGFQRNLSQDHSTNIYSSLEFGWEMIFQIDDSFPLTELKEHSRADVERRLRLFEAKRSCVRFTPAIEQPVWFAWGNQLIEERRFAEAEELFRRLLADLPFGVRSLMLVDFPGKHFNVLPAAFQELIATHYWALYAEAQYQLPQFAVHRRNMDIVEYLQQN